MTHLNRRELLKQTGGAFVATTVAAAGTARAAALVGAPQAPTGAPSPFFPGFSVADV